MYMRRRAYSVVMVAVERPPERPVAESGDRYEVCGTARRVVALEIEAETRERRKYAARAPAVQPRSRAPTLERHDPESNQERQKER